MSVRDILGIEARSNQGNTLQSVFAASAGKKEKPKGKKKGPSRELEALTQQWMGDADESDDDSPRQRPNVGVTITKKLLNQRHVVCGKWDRKSIDAFENVEPNPSLMLYGWEKIGTGNEPDYFEVGPQPEIYRFKSDEYQKHFAKLDNNWSKRDTEILFDLCAKFGLRFHVVQDQWSASSNDYTPPLRTCGIEDIKKRFYSIAKVSVEREYAAQIAKRPGDKQLLTHDCQKNKMVKFNYDPALDVRRKEQLLKQYEATVDMKLQAEHLKDYIDIVDTRILKEKQYISESKRLLSPIPALPDSKKHELHFGSRGGGVYSACKLLKFGPWCTGSGASESDKKRAERVNDFLETLQKGKGSVDVEALKEMPTKRCIEAWGSMAHAHLRYKQLQEAIERRKKDLTSFQESAARYAERKARRQLQPGVSSPLPSPSASPMRLSTPLPSASASPSPSPLPKRARRK